MAMYASWWPTSVPTPIRVMSHCQMAQSHYLNQCSLTICLLNTQYINPQVVFEICTVEIKSVSPRGYGKWVYSQWQHLLDQWKTSQKYAGVELDIFKMGSWNHLGCTRNMIIKMSSIFFFHPEQKISYLHKKHRLYVSTNHGMVGLFIQEPLLNLLLAMLSPCGWGRSAILLADTWL